MLNSKQSTPEQLRMPGSTGVEASINVYAFPEAIELGRVSLLSDTVNAPVFEAPQGPNSSTKHHKPIAVKPFTLGEQTDDSYVGNSNYSSETAKHLTDEQLIELRNE